MPRSTKKETGREGDGRRRTSFYLPDNLMERARDAAYWTRLSLSGLVEAAIEREIRRLARREGHREGAFPKRKAQLKPGRSVK